jgi:hypothetical protein
LPGDFTAVRLARAAFPGGVAVTIMAANEERPDALTFADRVDRIVHDELNLSSPPARAHNLPAGVGELASAFVLLRELLDIHKKLLIERGLGTSPNDALLPALRVLDDLKTGLRGPIWEYVECVQATRRPKHKTEDDVLNETFQAAMVGLVRALQTKFGGSRRLNQLLIQKDISKPATLDQLKGWHKKFENMEAGDRKSFPDNLCKQFLERNYSDRQEMVSRCVRRVLDTMKRDTGVGRTGS